MKVGGKSVIDLPRKSSLVVSDPFHHGAGAILAPQQIVVTVEIEIAGSDDMPVVADLEGCIGVPLERAVALAEPFGQRSVLGPPHDVFAPVRVEIAQSRELKCGWK